MRPVNQDGSEWAQKTANAKINEIKQAVKREMLARDEERSGGRMNAGNNWAPYVEVPKDAGGHDPHGPMGARYVIDPALAAIKHTGADSEALIKERWAEFCAAPRDEKAYAEQLERRMREEQLNKLRASGAAIPDDGISLQVPEQPVAPPVDVVEQPPQKRGRGRPRKHPLRT